MVPQYYYKLCIKFRCVRGYCTGRTEGLRAWRRLPVLVSKVLNLSPNFLRLVNPGNLGNKERKANVAIRKGANNMIEAENSQKPTW